MAPPRMSREALQKIADAVREYGGVHPAAKALGMPRGTIQHQAARAVAEGLLHDTVLTPRGPQPSPRLPVTADECWQTLDTFIGRKRIPKIKPPKWKATKAQRIVVAGDFHAPFTDNEAVATLIAEEGPRTDTLIVSGDLMDFYSISRFLKYERVTIEQEIAATDALLGQLSAAFPDVLIVSGNHDSQRFEKQLRSMLAPEMMHVIELLTGGNLSVIHMLAKRYPNVRFAPQKAGSLSLGWMTQVGDLLVTHAEKYSRVPGSALRQIDEGLTDFADVYELKPWRVLIQAHTHQLGMFPFKADRLLVEGGAMCLTHGYQMTARMGGRPQRIGYVTLQQTLGRTDINSVRMRWLAAEKQVA